MKPGAREKFIQALLKEDLDMDFESMPDIELKWLHTKMQHVKQGYCKYQMIKKAEFEDVLVQGRMQYVTFRGVPGVRRLTFKEYLRLEEFTRENPAVYPGFEPIR